MRCQVFIGFANFYYRFIKTYNKIATTLIAILKFTSFHVFKSDNFLFSKEEKVVEILKESFLTFFFLNILI